MDNIKVAIWGFGAMGSGIAKVLLNKRGVDITGVCDIHPERVGKSIFNVLGMERGEKKDVVIMPNIEDVVNGKNCDICVIATDSFTKKAFPKIKYIVQQGVNVVSTAEEMSYPKAQEPELAREMDELAEKARRIHTWHRDQPRAHDGPAGHMPFGLYDRCGIRNLQEG